MLISMTGYGSASRETEDSIIRVEVKSLNSRNLDLSLRIPRQNADKEFNIRSLISPKIERGKVSFSIEVENLDPSKQKKILNKELLNSYLSDLIEIANNQNLPKDGIIQAVLSLPDVYQSSNNETSDEEWALVESTINDAIVSFIESRKREGEILENEIRGYIANIEKQVIIIEGLKDERIPRFKAQLKEKLSEILQDGKIDTVRLEQELIYYAEKLDITEELVRLKSHIAYFYQILKENSPGKKIGFVLQEIGREINTTGSKANDAEITKSVVVMKEELEKIKEQSLNIL